MSDNAEKLVINVTRSLSHPKLIDLVERLKDDGMNSRDATKTIYGLWKKDALDLLEPGFSSTLFRYAQNPESLWFWTTTALVALMIPTTFYVFDQPLVYLRYVLGLFFAVYLPGSMLIEAMYPKSQDLERPERLALSIGLSLALVPLIGLLLNYTPWGIRLAPITISMAAFTEALAITALLRKYRYYVLTRARS